MQVDIDKLNNHLRNNGYSTGCMNSSSSEIVGELFRDLCTVMAIVGTGDADTPIRQKVIEMKTIQESSQSKRYDLRSKEHSSNYRDVTEQSTSKKEEQDVNYQSMIEQNNKLQQENRKLKFEFDETVKKLHEAVKKGKGYADRVTKFEQDFKILKSCSDKHEPQIASLTAIEKGLNEEMDRLRTKIDHLEHHQWQSKNYETHQRIKSQQREIDSLKGKQTIDSGSKRTHDDSKTERNQFEIQLDILKEQINLKTDELLKMNKSFDTMQKSNDERISNLNHDISKRDITLIELKKNLNETQKKLQQIQERIYYQGCKNCKKLAWSDRSHVNMCPRGQHTDNYWARDTNNYSRSGGEPCDLMDVDNVAPSAGCSSKDKKR